MSEEEVRKVIEDCLQEYLVMDQLVSGTASEMGLDSLDFFEFIIDLEGDIEDMGFKIDLDKVVTLDMTVDQMTSIIHKML